MGFTTLVSVALVFPSVTQAAIEISASNPAVNDYLGAGLGISDGQVLVGVPGEDQKRRNAGAVQVLEKVAGKWAVTDTLIASDAGAGDWFGFSVVSFRLARVNPG